MSEICPAELPNWCARRHWSIFWILIVCSLAMVTGRVLNVGNQSFRNPKPFFSANDRSRWATVRALGDTNTFEIDTVIDSADGRQWDTIDKVRHVGPDGQQHHYSSKPPLLSVLVTGPYKLLNRLTGLEIESDTVAVVRILLVLVNVIPWGIYLCFVARMLNTVPVRDWTRYYILACAGFGTFLMTFTVTLNNHLPAAISAAIALYCTAEIVRRKTASWIYYAAAGLFAAFLVSNEMPALAMFACLGLVSALHSIRKTIVAFVPASVIIAAAFFGANYWAHGQLKPPYAQRSDGPAIAIVAGDFSAELNAGKLPEDMLRLLPSTLDFKQPTVEVGAWPGTPSDVRRWVVRDSITASQLAIVSSDLSNFEIRAWGNWYDYPMSHWLATNDMKKSDVDLGERSATLYAFHCLFGHHGVFSLTPIWLLSLAGMVALVLGAKLGGGFQMRWLGAIGLVVSIVVIAFYINRPAIDRNYGGFTCCLRWLLWLVPIWLMSMMPVVDWLGGSRWGKFLCLILLLASAVSALYPASNPWVHPWLYEIWDWTGLPK